MTAELMTAKEVAAYLGVDRRTFYRRIYGRLTPVRLGPNSWARYRKTDVDQFIESRKETR